MNPRIRVKRFSTLKRNNKKSKSVVQKESLEINQEVNSILENIRKRVISDSDKNSSE